ncbi:MAG TPA: sulfotransferase [Verrucomicrobiae bacterium]|nr:sulfotransferase [Verrucomicrobiae bacterium]
MNFVAPALNGENLIFVVGSPRSGTTWLQRLLASHPRVKTGQESRLFEYVGWQLRIWKQDLAQAGKSGRGGQGLPCYLTEPEFLAELKRHLGALLSAMVKDLAPGEFFLEKTPGHALWINEILELLPQSRFVHLIRDPRDVTASMLAAARDWGSNWATRRARKAARLWAQHVQAAREAGSRVPAGQFLELFYEDLFRAPEATVEKVAGFLNLPWSPAEIAAAVKANSAAELRKEKGTPIPLRGEQGKIAGTVHEPKNFVRKAHPGSWREDLTWLERLQVGWELNRKMPDWKKYAKA